MDDSPEMAVRSLEGPHAAPPNDQSGSGPVLPCVYHSWAEAPTEGGQITKKRKRIDGSKGRRAKVKDKQLRQAAPMVQPKNTALKPRKHLIIPDVQAKPGVPLDHLTWIGNYIAEKRPDVIVQIGDFADMPSLSSYSLGKAEAEGQRYQNDLNTAHHAMRLLTEPFRTIKNYHPEMHLTLGNHEDRIDREAECNPKFEGYISTADLHYEDWGWTVHPFLKIIKIDGIEYTHYFTSGSMGRPVTSAAAILRTRHSSGVMGHVQMTDIAFHPKSGHIGIISSCAYQHEEAYLTPQMEGKAQRRQIVMLHEVSEGIADPMFASLDFLRRRYS
jgi:hypothetical protein